MRVKLFFFLFFVVIFINNIFPQEKLVIGKVKILAEKKERSKGFVECWRNVEVIFNNYRIYADYVKYVYAENKIEAEGRVTISSKNNTISSENLIFHLKDKTGVMYDMHGLIEPTLTYKSKEVKQIKDGVYKFKGVDFTSCNQCNPRWLISGSRGTLKQDRYIEIIAGVLRIKKIPVFFLPYMRYPIRKDGKATGFLMPGFGRSDLRGNFINMAYFWNIKPNLDLTFYYDLYSNSGYGLAGELRYMLKNLSGSFKYYSFNYSKEDNPYGKKKGTREHYIEAKHNQTFNLGEIKNKLTLHIDKPSDPGMMRVLSNNLDRVLWTFFKSSASFSSSYKNYCLSLSASRNETFYTWNNQSNVLKYLPLIKFEISQKQFGKIPGYFSLNSSFINASREGKAYEEEQSMYNNTGVSSSKFNFKPQYSLPLIKNTWINTSLDIGSNISYYLKSYKLGTREVVDTPLMVAYHSIGLDIKGPSFQKIYTGEKNKYKHLIEPKLYFRLSTKYNDDDLARIIRVDMGDMPSFSLISFGVNNRLYRKDSYSKDAETQEILYIGLSQSFYFDEKEASRFRQIEGKYPKWSDTSCKITFSPLEKCSLNFYGKYNYYIKRFSFFSTNFSFDIGGVANIKLNAGYRSFYNPFAPKNYRFNMDTINAGVDFDHPSFPLRLSGSIDYDITNKEFRQAYGMAVFKYQCINFQAQFKVFKFIERVEAEVRFGISLGNLGVVNNFINKNK